jgi:hypothetical protein
LQDIPNHYSLGFDRLYLPNPLDSLLVAICKEFNYAIKKEEPKYKTSQ